MEDNEKKFIMIMLFYVALTSFLGPYGYYKLFDSTLEGAGNGFVLGSILSLALWYGYGRDMVVNQ